MKFKKKYESNEWIYARSPKSIRETLIEKNGIQYKIVEEIVKGNVISEETVRL
ncbi:MAG: hypothetical protein ACPG4Z_07530 [Chitinophagales bacterium]